MKTPFQLETLEKAYAGLLSLTFFILFFSCSISRLFYCSIFLFLVFSWELPVGDYEGGVVGEVGIVGLTIADVVLSPAVEGQEGVAGKEVAKGIGVAGFSSGGAQVGFYGICNSTI